MPTYVATPTSVTSRWHLIDAEGQVLGRVASHAARLLQGKHKATYTPFIDTGDHVVIVNAAKVNLTGRKEEQKIYRRHSGYSGGLREERAESGPPASAGAADGRGRARHAAEVEAGRRDVPQGQGLRGRYPPARGTATHSVRGRINLGCYSVLRYRTPQGSHRARFPPPRFGHDHRQSPRLRQLLPHRGAARAGAGAARAHRNRRDSSTCSRRSAAAASPARPARIRLGIARALCAFNAELRPRLKKDGLLTRDARAKERKKYGMAGARKRFQFSKR